ncbi:Rmf/CrpP fold protein [Streptomyces echinoruber]|uniref:Uncharacterized protein n=1 Tax=Streptomyces echinoruber TaxID=68898 RepID=A0A918S441_9ACTN|nr:Rmf/CrpP fold protein [Streptomyces echinoruber]GHA20448.1 hypothetical protein GCM10010389_66680 [Streptomyces echinoruber]
MARRAEITAAVLAGREAGSRGDPVTACPYPATDLRRRAWVSGYAQTRTVAQALAEHGGPDVDQDVAD